MSQPGGLRKISAQDLITDIRVGMPDTQLMAKYNVSLKTLKDFYRKLEIAKLRCPSCGETRSTKFDECPECGVIAGKFMRQRAEMQERKEARLFFDRANDFFGRVDVSDITPDWARKFQTWLRSKLRSESYCDKHVAMMKAAWHSSVWDRPNPFSQVKLFHPDNTLVRWLTDDLARSILARIASNLGTSFNARFFRPDFSVFCGESSAPSP